jgi:hypothetical protein
VPALGQPSINGRIAMRVGQALPLQLVGGRIAVPCGILLSSQYWRSAQAVRALEGRVARIPGFGSAVCLWPGGRAAELWATEGGLDLICAA